MSIKQNTMQRILDFFKKNQDRIILTISAILIAGTSFSIGRISTDNTSQKVEIKENISQQTNINSTNNANLTNIQEQDNSDTTTEKNDNAKINTKQDQKTIKQDKEKVKKDCAFVASSRGKKYYEANSSSAKNLSPKNLICFPDEKEAMKAGYEPSNSIK